MVDVDIVVDDFPVKTSNMVLKITLMKLYLYMLQVHVLRTDIKVVVILDLAFYSVLLVAVTVINYVTTIMTVVLTFWKLVVSVSYDKVTMT